MKRTVSLLIILVLISGLLPVAQANEHVTVYAPDGRTAVISKNDVQAWKNVGWYDYPVATVYAPDGRAAVISKNAVQAWKNVGWYDYPVATVYAPDGRTAVISKNAVPAWKNVGWYDYPVAIVYAPDGRSAVIAKSALQTWLNVGWYATADQALAAAGGTPQTFYANKLPWQNSNQQWAIINLEVGPYSTFQQNKNYYIEKYFSSLSAQERQNIKHYANNTNQHHIYLIIPRYKTTNTIKEAHINFETFDADDGRTICSISEGLPFSVQVNDPAGDIHPILKVKDSSGNEFVIHQNLSDIPGRNLLSEYVLDLTEWYYY